MAAKRSSLKDIFAIHCLDERILNRACSKEHRDELTKRIKNWKAVGAALGFTQEELDMIDSGYENDGQKKTTLFIQWSMRVGKEATYLNLAKLLFAGKQLDPLQQLCTITKLATPTSSTGKLGSSHSKQNGHALSKKQLLEKFAAVRSDKHIQKFVVCAVPTEKELGKGSWGSMREVEVEGLICVGKVFKESLFANKTVIDVTSKFAYACQSLSNLRHPNIIQFLGVCFLQDRPLPVIVMEKLEGNLHSLLETVANIPMTLKQSLLEDVARGLHYLHSFNPAITHGALTARNVLYTSSLVAKISDISNCQLVKFQSRQLDLSLETLSYMPSDAASQSSPKQDVFSFGHIALFILTQVFPMKLDQHCRLDRRVSQYEIEHRKQCVQRVERLLHPLSQSLVRIIKKCLHNDPKKRPVARDLLTTLEEMKPTAMEEVVTKMNAVRQVLAAKQFADLEQQLKKITEEHNKTIKDKEREIDEIMASKEREIKELVKSKEKEIQELTETKDREMRELEESKDREIEELRACLKQQQRQPEGIINRAVQLPPVAASGSGKGGRAVPKSQDVIALTLLCGYYAARREEPTPEGYTHDWTAFVKGDHERGDLEDGHDIQHVVRKVVFQLHESFKPNDTRVVKEPPYKISVSGNGSFDIRIKVYFNNNEKAKFQYGLNLFTCQVSTVLRDILTFRNPSKNFREKLILAGGQPCQSLPTSQKAKPKKRPTSSDSVPPKSKKKRRLDLDNDNSDSDLNASSWSEGKKSIPTISSDSSSDDEWTLSQASKI